MSLQFLAIVSGERRGFRATVARGALAFAALVYALLLAIRRALYGWGIRKTRRVDGLVLSVGNIVAGGTGKTPMVEHLARLLLARGRRPAIVSRGYGAKRGERNDEARVLAANLPSVPQVQDPDRVRGATKALAEKGADAIILDDGFQHWRIARDLDLVLVDALEPFGFRHLLPRGLLREPVTALARADVVAITRADLCPPERLEAIREEVRAVRPGLPLLEVVDAPQGLGWLEPEEPLALPPLPADEEPGAALVGRRILAFAGIGNPAGFFRRLERLGADVVHRCAFPDHHPYREAEIDALLAAAAKERCDVLVTTQKDAVKIAALGAEAVARWRKRLRILKIRLHVRRGEAELDRLLDDALLARAPARKAEVAA